MPQVRRGRHGRAQGAPGQHLLGLHQLSQVRLHFELQAGGEEVPGVRKPVPGGEDAEVGHLPRMPEQEEGAEEEVAPKKRGKKAPKWRKAARWSAPTPSASAMRRLRRRRRRTARWWKRRTEEGTAAGVSGQAERRHCPDWNGIPQGLKPTRFWGICGTAEAVPIQNAEFLGSLFSRAHSKRRVSRQLVQAGPFQTGQIRNRGAARNAGPWCSSRQGFAESVSMGR